MIGNHLQICEVGKTVKADIVWMMISLPNGYMCITHAPALIAFIIPMSVNYCLDSNSQSAYRLCGTESHVCQLD